MSDSTWGIEAYDLQAYLHAVGLEEVTAQLAAGESPEPTLELLTRLHEAHVRTFPFSNVHVLLGDHPGVAPETVERSLVEQRRGGYCFEQAQLFAGILEQLGFRVERHLGRVHEPSNSRTHLTVLVDLDGTQYLCDPGFGFSLRRPMLLSADKEHEEGDRTYRLIRHGKGAGETWELTRDGETEHILDFLPVVPVDVRSGHLITSTPGFGPFTDHLMVMRHTANGHVTVTESARTVRTFGEPTQREQLPPEQTVAAVRELDVTLDDAEAARLEEKVRQLQEAAEN